MIKNNKYSNPNQINKLRLNDGSLAIQNKRLSMGQLFSKNVFKIKQQLSNMDTTDISFCATRKINKLLNISKIEANHKQANTKSRNFSTLELSNKYKPILASQQLKRQTRRKLNTRKYLIFSEDDRLQNFSFSPQYEQTEQLPIESKYKQTDCQIKSQKLHRTTRNKALGNTWTGMYKLAGSRQQSLQKSIRISKIQTKPILYRKK